MCRFSAQFGNIVNKYDASVRRKRRARVCSCIGTFGAFLHPRIARFRLHDGRFRNPACTARCRRAYSGAEYLLRHEIYAAAQRNGKRGGSDT